MFRNLQTKLKYDHGLILQRVCIRLQGSPDDFRKDRGYAARHIVPPEAESHNGAVPGPAPARIGHPRPLPATGLFRRRIPRGRLRPLPGRLENPLHHRPDGRASRMEDRAGDRTRDVGHRRGAYAGRLRPLQGDRRRQARRIHQPVLCPALLLQHLGRKHHPAVRIRHAEDPQSFPRRGVRHLLRRGAVLHQLPAANPETLRVQIRLPEMSGIPAGAGTRRPTAANWSTGSAPTAVRSSLRRATPAKSSRKTRYGRPRHGAMRRSTSTPASHTASPTPWGCATRMRDGNTAPGSGQATASATTRSTSRGGSISNG